MDILTVILSHSLELKAEGSLASVTTYAYYRELMHFFGRPKLAHLVLSRYTASNVDFRLFTPYYRSDACHYAVESLDLVNADRWERDYWRKTGLPGFYVSDNVDVESGNSGYSVPVPTYSDDRRRMTSFDGGRDPNAEFATARFLRVNTIQEKRDVERLPPFLERDAHMPFLLVRIAKIGVTVEAALKKCVMALQEERGDVGRTSALSDLVATCERLDRTLSVELEMLGKNLDDLVKANAVVGPNMRYIALFRVVTAWQVWGLYGMARVKWFARLCLGMDQEYRMRLGNEEKVGKVGFV
ncbi:hypothetical protein BC829DRAFT_28232 [Chytridium lagenaria]|nr:hypothetical protein BC829DRAFT_28232 [Chytridium lagenaria]